MVAAHRIGIARAAREFGVSRRLLHEAVKAGELAVVRLGRRYFTTAEAMTAFLTPRPIAINPEASNT